MSGQLYPTPARLGRDDDKAAQEWAEAAERATRPSRRGPSSQAGLATLRAGAMPDRAAFSILAAQAGPEGTPVGSILRTADGTVYRRGQAGWFRLGAVSHTPDTPAGDLIYRGRDQ